MADAKSTVVGADSEQGLAGHDRSPAIAAGLSFLWPGLGQFFLGRRRAAIALAVPAVLVAIVAAIQASQGALMFAANLWDETYFAIFAVVVVAFGAWRVLAVGHAFLSASQKRRPRPIEFAFVAALLALILAMHGLFVAGAWAWYDTSVNIQNNDMFAVASSSAAPTTPPPPTPTPVPTPSPVDTSVFVPFAMTPSPNPTPVKSPNPNRITFLLIGVDFLTGRSHSLTDTMMLVSIDTSTEKVDLVSVPRDTSNFDLYYGGWVGATFKLNTLLTAAASSSFGSPDPPMKTLENEIGYLVGVPVDYYAAIDMNGFPTMIDAVGGVDVYNPRAINDSFTATYVPAGQVHLDGTLALKYVRSREDGGSDYLRAGRQQAVMIALERKVLSSAVLPHLGTLLSLAGRTIATDFPLNTARNYVYAAQHISSYETCVLGPPYSYHPDSSTTGGTWTSRLDMALVANLSVEMFSQDSRYYGQPGVVPAACGK
ncbi:MAG: LCP family protein [Candidatus Limnocylindrales bacterium]